MDYRKLADYFMANNAFARHIGIVVTDVGLGYAKGELEIKENYTNFSKGLHGAVYYALADTLAGIASKTHGKSSVTLEGKMNFIRAAKEGKIHAVVEQINQGRATGVYEGRVYDKDDKLVASATYTFYMLDKDIIIE
ncbi:MAG: PaaI family thioesterase [Peptostreptococcaceae bacterium]|nr:PaaI family thioesterase [Peptostreptococcaceae bacterium]